MCIIIHEIGLRAAWVILLKTVSVDILMKMTTSFSFHFVKTMDPSIHAKTKRKVIIFCFRRAWSKMQTSIENKNHHWIEQNTSMQQTMRHLRGKHCTNRVFVRQNMQIKLMTKAQQKRVTNFRVEEATALHKTEVYHANLTGAKGRLACTQT